ncbi:uncharacterized protein LOC142903000 isoform X3 [Nelusetta ayraudi]|uniref:uncharacterized protein LOC142903000 isoform X3 n=1 Tax=Nelusetta ayraudi TaxID=303726 RepID=UPI003F7161E9
MSLVDEIKCIDLEAGRVLATKYSDSEIASLTPEERDGLFAGPEHVELRPAICKVISSKKEVERTASNNEMLLLLKEMNERFEHVVMNQNEMKKQLHNVQKSLDTVVQYIEQEKSRKCVHSEPSGTSLQIVEGDRPSRSRSNRDHSYTQPPSKKKIVQVLVYQTIVSGKTFGAHDELMNKMKRSLSEVIFQESKKDHNITILFCPISSRIGADVTAAMSEVKDDKPIILVLMNHTHEPRCVAGQRTWSDYPNIKLFVHVFYHETKSGLLKCDQNDDAIKRIEHKLQDYYTKISGETPGSCGNPQLNQRSEDDSQFNQSACDDSRKSFFQFQLPKIF